MRLHFLSAILCITLIFSGCQPGISTASNDAPIEQYFSMIDKQDTVTIKDTIGDSYMVNSNEVLAVFSKYNYKVKQNNDAFYFTKGIQIYVFISGTVIFEHNGMGACRVKDGTKYINYTAPNEMYDELLSLLNK